MVAVTQEAFDLTHEGLKTLCQMERNGILIDTKILKKAIRVTKSKIDTLREELLEDKVFRKTWVKRFGSGARLGSKSQLEKIIFEDLGFERKGSFTSTGKWKSDKNAFELVDHPFVKKYFLMESWKKVDSTYLPQIKRETVGRRMYPIGELHKAGSYRGSYTTPSIQNFPVRVFEISQMVRQTIIPPKGFRVAEIDLSGAEVCGGACYHGDPKMIDYIVNPKSDMHRDMAMAIYKLKRGKDKYWKDQKLGKMVRYCAKNRYVFPTFYGSWYKTITRDLWEAIDLFDLKNHKGVSLKKHLAKKGIKERGDCNEKEKPERGTFEHHMMQVENDFWGEDKFQVYANWKDEFWNKYCKRGWFKYKTGFMVRGLYRRNQVVNYPIQGDSFHFLLWAMIELQKWLVKNDMKSKILFQIHDSMVMYLHESEIDKVLTKAHYIMTKAIRKHWKWITVPLTVEAEVAPRGKSWFEKVKHEIAA